MRNELGKLLFPALIGGAFLLLACDGGDGPSNPRDGGSNDEYNAFTDKRDGNVYRVVEVDGRMWMAENLRYRDVKADPILEDNSWCASGDKKKCEKEGFLYSWAAVMLDSSCAESKCDVVYPHRGICPEGWHVAENYEWQELFEFAAGQDSLLVKYPGFDWSPTGAYYADGDLLIDDVDSYYWTSSARASNEAFVWLLEDGLADFFHIESVKGNGFAVRCVADSGEVKLDKYVEFEIPERPSSHEGSSSSRRVYSSSSSFMERSSSSYTIDVSYVAEGGLNAFTDKRDGNVYRVLTVGPQIWMVDNLRYNDTAASPALKSYSWCIGSGDDCGKDGYLYDFAAVMDVPECAYSLCEVSYPHRGICPEGWHVPSNDEWDFLLKEAVALGVPLDSYLGFPSAPTGEHGSKTTMDNCARYWTASQANAEASYEYYRCGRDSNFYSQSYRKSYGYALRCVADSGEVKLDKYIIPEESSSSSEKSSSSSRPQYSCDYSCFSSSSNETLAESSSSEGYVFRDDLETFTDERDGEVYRVVEIGTQVWMAENLRYVDSTETPVLKGSTFCWQDDPENCKVRGALYLWHAAMGKTEEECGYEKDCSLDSPVRGICPAGFHVPTDDEWLLLQSVVGIYPGSRMWAVPRGTDAYGFGAVPSGEMDGREGRAYSSGENAHYWSATSSNSRSAVDWYLHVNEFKGQSFDKRMGYAVRCVRDAENTPD